MHWCMDETLAVLAMIPFIGYFFRKLHAWYHAKMGHTCHEKHCDSTHVEHKYSPFDREPFQKVSEKDMEYLRGTPAPLKITIPNIVIWDPISQEDVEERFGKSLVKYLYEDAKDSGLESVTDNEVYWYVTSQSVLDLRAEVRGKVFLHDEECCEYGWRLEQ